MDFNTHSDHELNSQERALYKLHRTGIIQEFGETLKDEVESRDAVHAHDQTLAGTDTGASFTARCAATAADSTAGITIGTRNQAGIVIGSDGTAVSERRTAEHKMSAVGSTADDGGVGTLQS